MWGSFFILILLSSCTPGVTKILQDVQSKIPPANLPKLPTIDDVFRVTPVSTSFDDAYSEAAQLDSMDLSDQVYVDIKTMPRTDTGQFILSPGLYELEAESFCLKPGVYGPSAGDGYLAAPLEGDRKDIVYKILSTYASHPNVTQRQAQVLLWAIIARTQFTDMPLELQATAAVLLTPEELFELNNGALGLVPDVAWAELQRRIPPEVQQIYAAERQLRNLLNQANYTYESLEGIAVLAGVAPASDLIREVSRGRWAEHPDGYFVRYFPNGYQQTRIEVLVPDKPPSSSQEDSQGSGVVVFDPSSTVAAPANTSAQRLAPGTPDGKLCEMSSPDSVKGSFFDKAWAYLALTHCACFSNTLSDDVKTAIDVYFSEAWFVVGKIGVGEGLESLTSWTSLSDDSLKTLNDLSDAIYIFNKGVIESTIDNNKLRSPIDQREITNPVEWIVDQVKAEQGAAEEFLNSNVDGTSTLISDMNTFIDQWGDAAGSLPDEPVGLGAIDWAQEHVPDGTLDYGNLNHRVALGVAVAFKGLGLDKKDYDDFMNSGMKDYPQISKKSSCFFNDMAEEVKATLEILKQRGF
jgi:hypothetical protein